jgi:hypothetical protein
MNFASAVTPLCSAKQLDRLSITHSQSRRSLHSIGLCKWLVDMHIPAFRVRGLLFSSLLDYQDPRTELLICIGCCAWMCVYTICLWLSSCACFILVEYTAFFTLTFTTFSINDGMIYNVTGCQKGE